MLLLMYSLSLWEIHVGQVEAAADFGYLLHLDERNVLCTCLSS
jgi:hypothetical protein